MSPLAEVGLTCARELRRNLRSAKGIVMALLFLLGGGTASVIYAAISEYALRKDVPEDAFRAEREYLWTQVFDDKAIGHYLAPSPLFFVGLFKALWWLIPFLTLLIGFEQVCSDLQHRSIRYDVIRARRSSIVVGKALAIWIVVSVLVLVLDVFVWIVTLWRGDATLGITLSWGIRFWLWSVVFVGTWSGLTILASSLTRRPILSLFIGLIGFSTLVLGDLATWGIARASKGDETWWLAKFAPARFAFPGFYEDWLVSPDISRMLGAVAILLAFGAAGTALASWIVDRSDV